MSAAPDKPDVLERLGSALNSSDLSPEAGRIGAVELLGALAYAQTNPGADEHDELAVPRIDARTELGAMLVRLKIGGDRVLGEQAVHLLADWVRHQKAYRNWRLEREFPRGVHGPAVATAAPSSASGSPTLGSVTSGHGPRRDEHLAPDTRDAPGYVVRASITYGSPPMAAGECAVDAAIAALLVRFARQSLAEWLYPTCQVCNGRKMLGLERGEIVQRRVRCTRCKGQGMFTEHRNRRGRIVQLTVQCMRCGGSGSRTVSRVKQGSPRECYGCLGTGLQRANDAERVRALQIAERVYQRHWARRFAWLAAGLDRLDSLIRHCLQSQMRERTVPPQQQPQHAPRRAP